MKSKIDFDKLDKMDIVVLNEEWSLEETKAFSEYLKSRKEKASASHAHASREGLHAKSKQKARLV